MLNHDDAVPLRPRFAADRRRMAGALARLPLGGALSAAGGAFRSRLVYQHTCSCSFTVAAAPSITFFLTFDPAVPALGMIALDLKAASLQYSASILHELLDHALRKSTLSEDVSCLLLVHVLDFSVCLCVHSSRSR